MKNTVIILVAAIAVALIGYALFSEPAAQLVQVTQVKLADLHSSIHTNGKAEAETTYEIRAPFSGACTQILAKAGDILKAGQAILEMDDSALRTDLAEAKAEREAAEVDLKNVSRGAAPEELNQAEAEVARYRIEMENAAKIVETNEWLLQRQAISRFELEESRRTLARAEHGKRAAEIRVRDLKGRFDASDLKRADSRLAAAKARIEHLERTISRATLRSPAGGTLYHFEIQHGAFLNAGDLVGLLAEIERMRVRAFVDEPELGRVREGAEVLVRWDARPSDVWKGKVVRIPPQIVSRGSRSVAEVLCEIRGTQQTLVPNINLDVEILTGEGEKVPTLPRACVVPDGKSHFVWVIRNGLAARQIIQTGRSSPSVIEVTGGLSSEDKVILPGETPLSEGMRVRIQG